MIPLFVHQCQFIWRRYMCLTSLCCTTLHHFCTLCNNVELPDECHSILYYGETWLVKSTEKASEIGQNWPF